MDDERAVSELEAAIADTGSLLVRLQKYRRGAEVDGVALQRDAMALGDRARRLSRSGRLDAATTAELHAAVGRVVERARALLAGVQATADYRAAVAAHAAGDQAMLGRTLPAIFAGIATVEPPPALVHTLTWRRRNRPRPAAELVAEIAALRTDGLPGVGDDLAAGVDPMLPAVVLESEPAPDEPAVLRLATATLGVPVYQLEATGEHLVYAARLRAPFTVVLARTLDPEAVESTPLDYQRWRAGIADAMTAAGIAFDEW